MKRINSKEQVVEIADRYQNIIKPMLTLSSDDSWSILIGKLSKGYVIIPGIYKHS